MRFILFLFLLNFIISCSWIEAKPEEVVEPKKQEVGREISDIFLIGHVAKFIPETYKLTIQQGNEITAEMLLRLKPEMTKSQVSFALGTPLIKDSFHENRWDYIYAMRKDGKFIESRHVVLFFEGDLLKKIIGGDVISISSEANLEKPEIIEEPIIDSNEIPRDDMSYIEEKNKDLDKELTELVKNKDNMNNLIKKDIIESPPEESSPGYFELILEKIGF
jgi:outer membrane protein assembly factor BamE